MTEVLRLPFTSGFLDELEDAFIDKRESLPNFMFHLVSAFSRDAKLCKLNNSTPVNKLIDRQRKQETVKFKDIDMDSFELPRNLNWIPKDMDKDDVKFFDMKLRDKTMEYLVFYGKIFSLRVREYNKSVAIHEQDILDELKNNKSDDAGTEAQEKSNLKAKEAREDAFPSCLEQAIYEQIFPKIHDAVSKNVDAEADAEFAELYGDDEKARDADIKKRAEEQKKKSEAKEKSKPKESPNRNIQKEDIPKIRYKTR